MSRIKTNEVKIGRYGRMRLAFIKEHQKDLYTELLFSGNLENYLRELNEEALDRIWEYTRQIAKVQGIDEELKARDQMAWVGAMNAIRAQAEEIVIRELIKT